MKPLLKPFIALFICFTLVFTECYNKCSGHGTCDSNNRCVCHKQLGLGLNDADFNAVMYTGADCSERVCPTSQSFIPVEEDAELVEINVIKNKDSDTRFLNEKRDLDGDTTDTPDDGNNNKETPIPTPSIDEILANLTSLNATELETPIEQFKPITSNTPSLGGAMKCKGEGEDTYQYITISSQVGNKLISDKEYEEGELKECKVTYVRKDLSLFGILDFGTVSTTKWNNGEEMRLYGFQYNQEYDVNAACVHDESNIIVEEYGKVTLFNDEKNEYVKFTYKKAKKDTYPLFCYLLSVGVDNNGKVHNIELLSSELSEMVGKSSEGLIFGDYINNGAVVIIEGKDIFPGKATTTPTATGTAGARSRLLQEANANGAYPIILNLNAQYVPPTIPPTTPPPTVATTMPETSPETSPETTPEPTITTPTLTGETDTTSEATDTTYPGETTAPDQRQKTLMTMMGRRVLADDGSSVIASEGFGVYKQYLQIGNKIYIRILNNNKYLPPQTMYLAEETQTCKRYCEINDQCGISEPNKDGCYVVFLNEGIYRPHDDVIVYFTLTAIGVHPIYECSGVGKCNRQTGQCECLPGYSGNACQILSCPNHCSYHGRCVKSSQTIFEASTQFVDSVPDMFGYSSNSKQKLYGCICDEGYRGPDCSLIECPSTKDPGGATNNDIDGEFRDCSGRGICDYGSGNCVCFDGYFGSACENTLSII